MSATSYPQSSIGTVQLSARTKRIRIVHVITSLGRGGAESVLTRLVLATRTEFEHAVVSLRDESHFGRILRGEGIEVHALRLGYGRNLLGAVMELIGFIRRRDPAVTQTWLYHADLLGGLAARLAFKGSVIWGVRNTNLGQEAIRRSTQLVAWLSARLSGIVPDAIACNSIVARGAHIKFGYSGTLFRIIPNGYDIERFRPDRAARVAIRAELGVAPGEALIGNVARWDAQKDHATLLAALRLIVEGRPGIRLLLVGDRMERSNASLVSLVRKSALDAHVILAGPRDDIPAVMNALDLHVTASLGEAFPNAVAEAMACGTPCVVTDVGDAAHIVGNTGWVTRSRDPGALAAAIQEALRELERERDVRSVACRARIVDNFSLTRMTTAYATLWREFARVSAEAAHPDDVRNRR
jgi:glycosyltransferase involved in cell wall biosynthesis